MPGINPLPVFLIFWSLLHPFYISLTDMVYNEGNQTIEIAQKIFWDDLEVALSHANQAPVDFLAPADPAALDSMVASYLLAHNRILIDGDTIRLHYLGHEVEADAAWFYLESERISPPTQVTVFNSLLIDVFPEQQNIVNFYKNRKPKSLLTRKDKLEGLLILED
ncbi:hypothetical protein SAMN05192553_102826 [Cyclobacterium xiamenense]|uniref:Uncharacterized protein n=1 Tax=Cyclobacterium xiamenense TaxID=1297121 RepID=A0A1H6WU10_9BACT|nr:DUF6702 family protein [Cyclobacterium xiamenense]SEJ18734.1 hypothetical protein SAMN05192553_102826 [Cyclobacterium xiamenense]